MSRLSLALVALCACTLSTPTLPEYEAARAAALAPPPPLPADWKPDAALVISPPLMERIITAMLPVYGTFDEPFEVRGVPVIPDLQVTSASVTGAGDCPTCLAVDVSLSGTIEVTKPIRIRAPVDVKVGVDLDMEGKTDGADHVLTLKPNNVRTVEVRSAKLPKRVSQAMSGPLADLAREQLVKGAKPIEVARLQASGMPLLAIRPAAVRNGVRVDMRTAAATPTALVEPTDKVKNGYAIVIQEDTLLDLARKTSMEQGVVTWDIVPEPTLLDIGRDGFTMRLRLWRITGSGWWRDYEVKGAMTRDGNTVHFSPEATKELGASPGAAMADPLSELGRSEIIRNLELSMTGSIGTTFVQELGNQQASLSVDRVYGSGQAVFIQGDVTFAPVTGGATAAPAAPGKRNATGSKNR
ncbi:MAG: hypothetical protein AB8H79_01740 [Myxococcota bacterium]